MWLYFLVWKWIHNDLVRRRVSRQHGRVTWAQLKHGGLSDSTINHWVSDGRLIQVLPKVYAVGHRAPSREADLWAAILYAGPGAMLSHRTAAQWRGLINHAPRVIEVSTPRQITSTAGVRVYGRRSTVREFHERLPITSIAQTVFDLAATAPNLNVVRRALAVLDYRDELDLDALTAICGARRPGARLLRRALANHQPQLARTNGDFEKDFLEWCERWKVPVPVFNDIVHGEEVDAHWPEHGLVVELDGRDNHSSPAQIHHDRSKDMFLRSHGLTVHRYDWRLLHDEPRRVHDDVIAAINATVSSRSVR